VAVGEIRRKCFISYHQEDLAAVNDFIERFGPRNFIKRGVILPDDVIESRNTDYVMRRVREIYIRDSTVTIVLIGPCTWSRRFVDWEIQASLRPAGGLPNGLLGICLTPGKRPQLPPRFALNRDSRYARYHYYPPDIATLGAWVEDAYQARRQRATLRRNPKERFFRNRRCE
jgi:antiphage defense system Thoeris ThsB-like protein